MCLCILFICQVEIVITFHGVCYELWITHTRKILRIKLAHNIHSTSIHNIFIILITNCIKFVVQSFGLTYIQDKINHLNKGRASWNQKQTWIRTGNKNRVTEIKKIFNIDKFLVGYILLMSSQNSYVEILTPKVMV